MTAFSSTTGLAIVVAILTGVAAIRGIWSPCGLSMISAINPISQRARGHRYWLTSLWFIFGAVIGGIGLGLLGAAFAPLFARLPTGVTVLMAAVCCLVTLAGDVPAVGLRLPLIPRQVDERWLSGYRQWFYASGFGAQIGVGLATYVMTSAVYLVPILGALSGSVYAALAAGVLFGLIRGLAILLTARVRNTHRLLELHERISAAEPFSRWTAIAVQACSAVLFAWYVDKFAAVVVLGLIIGGALYTYRRRWSLSSGSAPSAGTLPTG